MGTVPVPPRRGQAVNPHATIPPIAADPTPPWLSELPCGALLTPEEGECIQLAGELWNKLCKIVGEGPTRSGDCGELIRHIHAIQHTVMAQAAARAYPSKYRLLGSVVARE